MSGLRPFGIKVVMDWTSPLKLAEGGAHECLPHFRVIGDPIELMLKVLNYLLYWYKSTNTDAGHAAAAYPSHFFRGL